VINDEAVMQSILQSACGGMGSNITRSPALQRPSSPVHLVAERNAGRWAGTHRPLIEPPVPPGAASMVNGRLKDTPANRALHPSITPQAQFTSPQLIDHAYYADENAIVLHEDVRKGLRLVIDTGIKVDCIVTSPPYYGQRDYDIDGQLGLEERPQEFIDRLVDIFNLCGELLSDTGSLWINIGDTYWSGKGAHKSSEAKQSARRFGIRPQDFPGDGKWTRPKQLLLIPHRLTIALQDAGWLVRNDNIWVKPNPVPDQVRDRCSVSHEYVFHLTKSRWYYFDRFAVGIKQNFGKVLPPLDTWTVHPSAGNGKHKATFSEELVRIPILGSTPPNGIVLDPFSGSGTSMVFARKNGFRSIGIDLSEDYCEQAADRLKKVDITHALGLEL
jgi:site-specific DNA-methyltransferase (cytosine-N4-specific)